MLAELMRVGHYGVVGLLATGTQIGVAEFFLLVAGLSPIDANLLGFLVAVAVSFTGHHTITFQRQRRPRDAFPRFAANAISAFVLNTIVLSLLVGARVVPNYLAIVVAIAVWVLMPHGGGSSEAGKGGGPTPGAPGDSGGAGGTGVGSITVMRRNLARTPHPHAIAR